MNWMFLNAPADGSVMLVWQPLNQLGTQFASDGYVWADVEQAFSSEAKGYVCDLSRLLFGAMTNDFLHYRPSRCTFTDQAITHRTKSCPLIADDAIA